MTDAMESPASQSNARSGGRTGLLLVSCLAIAGGRAAADGPFFSFEPSASWQDNVTNAPSGEGVLGDSAACAAGDASWVASPDFSTTVTCGLAAMGQVWARYGGLDSLSAGPRAEIRRKLGLGPYAAVVSAGLEADAVLFDEAQRSSVQGAVNAGCSRRFNDALQMELIGRIGGADARKSVFSGDYARLDAALNWDVDETWRVRLLGGWREGAVVTDYAAQWYNGRWVTADSYDAGAPGTFPAGYSPGQFGPWRFVTTFKRPFLAFRRHGRTWNYGLGLSPALGPRTSLLLQYTRFQTYLSAGKYVNNLVTAGVVRHF